MDDREDIHRPKKTREASAGGSFFILRRSVAAPESSTIMSGRIEVSTIARRRKSSSCADFGRPIRRSTLYCSRFVVQRFGLTIYRQIRHTRVGFGRSYFRHRGAVILPRSWAETGRREAL